VSAWCVPCPPAQAAGAALYEIMSNLVYRTTSIERNEYLSTLLKREGIAHQVLNAKQHEREANGQVGM